MPLSNSQLQGLWIQAGGSKQAAPTAAAIALAESSGDPQSHATQGEDSRGLWQINVGPGANTQYLGTNLWDPLTNAKVAVAMSGNGANWHPWTTYTKGTYQQFLQGLNPSNAPGSQAPTGATALSAMPPTSSTSFDQAGFNAADAKYIAGSYLAGSGKNPFDIGPKSAQGFGGGLSLIGPGLLSTSAPNPADYTKVVQTAQNSLQGLAGSTPLNVHPNATPGYGGYVNPIPGFNVGRTDMGVDASAAPGTPIKAIGNSKVIGQSPNWYAGQPYWLFQFLDGPRSGQYWYVSEQINPHVQPGQIVHAGDTVATFASSGTGIEIGFGSGTPGRTLAQEQGNTGDSSHNNAPAGVDFANFLHGLH